MNKQRSRKDTGSALLIVMVLLGIVMISVVANSVVMHHLRSELRLIEKEQIKEFDHHSTL